MQTCLLISVIFVCIQIHSAANPPTPLVQTKQDQVKAFQVAMQDAADGYMMYAPFPPSGASTLFLLMLKRPVVDRKNSKGK